MAQSSFRHRYPRALRAPSGIVLGASVGVATTVAGAHLAVAVPLGAVVWAAKAALSVPRRRAERIDPFGVHEPWRRFVQEALQNRNRFDEVVERMAPGPLQDNLRSVATRAHAGVDEVWRIAQQGDALQRARRGIDVADVERRRAGIDDGDSADPVHSQVAASLDAQKASADRLDRVIADAETRLRLLDARMDETLARAIELSAQPAVTASVGALGNDVDGLVTEMEALRRALEETHGAAGGLPSPGGSP